jgi:hypothetical protein
MNYKEVLARIHNCRTENRPEKYWINIMLHLSGTVQVVVP